MNAENTVYDVKRLIGRNFNDSSVQEDIRQWPFSVLNHANRPIIEVSIGKEQRKWKFTPEEISAIILLKMKVTVAMLYHGYTLLVVGICRSVSG